MIDTLLRALDLRTGRFTSPHVERMSERISIDGEPLSDEAFVRRLQRRRAVHAPHRRRPRTTRSPSSRRSWRWPTRPSPTRRSTSPWSRSAWAARGTPPTSPTARSPSCCRSRWTTRGTSATRPADIARREGRDHQAGRVRRPRPAGARRRRGAARQAAEVGATVAREGIEFGVASRLPAVGGQMISLQGLRGRYDEVFLPLYGAHQAQNAASRWRPSRRSPATRAARRRPGPRGVRGGHLARPARDHPAQPHDRARRRPQPPRGARRSPRRSRTRSRSPRSSACSA